MKTNSKDNRVFLNKDLNISGEIVKKKMSRKGGRGGEIGRIGSGRGSGGRRNFKSSNNKNKKKGLKFIRIKLDHINRRQRLLK